MGNHGFEFSSFFSRRNIQLTQPNKACRNCLESQEQKSSLKGKPVRIIIFPVGGLRRPRPSAGSANR